MTGNDQTPPWAFRAVDALVEVIHGENQKGADIVQELAAEYGPDAIPGSLLVWIDMVMMTTGTQSGELLHLHFRNSDTGEIDNVDGVSWDTAWAGRVISARVADDRDTFIALVNSVPDSQAWARVVWRTLECCALTIREATAGRN